MSFREYVRQFQARLAGVSLPIGMGCATIGQGADEARYEQFLATLYAAYDRGVRYYDTSAQYGGSEFRVGRWLRDVPRETVFLATKSPIPAALRPEEAKLYIKQALHNSLERLGVSQIDLFQSFASIRYRNDNLCAAVGGRFNRQGSAQRLSALSHGL